MSKKLQEGGRDLGRSFAEEALAVLLTAAPHRHAHWPKSPCPGWSR